MYIRSHDSNKCHSFFFFLVFLVFFSGYRLSPIGCPLTICYESRSVFSLGTCFTIPPATSHASAYLCIPNLHPLVYHLIRHPRFQDPDHFKIDTYNRQTWLRQELASFFACKKKTIFFFFFIQNDRYNRMLSL